MSTYRVKRFFYSDKYPSEVIATDLTKEQAQERCSDPEGSSRTARDSRGVALTAQRGAWFDGYEEEA